MTARLMAVAGAHVHILARWRTALILLALLPLACHRALYRHSLHAVTIGSVGVLRQRTAGRPTVPILSDGTG
jgi:hypothetical protein